MKKRYAAFILFFVILCTAGCGGKHVDTLTYAVFPYLPEVGYYQEIIEARWAELEPDIKLVHAEWNCYHDDKPEGIDVIMYDAVTLDKLITEGWIQPINPKEVQESGDIFSYALEGVTVQDKLYGIPVFLCGNFLIYDLDSETLARAEHITDLADESQILVINSEDSGNRHQYIIESIADTLGEANPTEDDGAEDIMALIDNLAVDAHKNDEDTDVVTAYDSGIGQGYIGFSESMRFLKNRVAKTGIKSISFSGGENIPRVYADAVAVTAGIKGEKYKKCLELMNVIAEADILTSLTVQEGSPQYLLIARKAPYQTLGGQFPIYSQLEELADNEKNQVILTP